MNRILSGTIVRHATFGIGKVAWIDSSMKQASVFFNGKPEAVKSPWGELTPLSSGDDGPAIFIPTKEQIRNLKAGDLALNAFGDWKTVDHVFATGIDVKGKAFCCFYTQEGRTGSTMSNDYTEGEIVRTVAVTGRYKSAELNEMEKRHAEAKAS